MVDCGVARWFIWEEICPWVSNVVLFLCLVSLCPTREKVQLCPQQGQNKALCPEFLLRIKAYIFGGRRVCCKPQ